MVKELPPILRAYVLAVLLGGLGFLAWVSADLGALDWQPRSLGNLILWSGMIAAAAMSPIPLPRGGATVTVTSALDFAAILIFVIQKSYFGWSIQWAWPWALLAAEASAIMLAAILASLYPAVRASRTLASRLCHADA